MSPIFHLVLLVFALCCFVFDAWQTPANSAPTRVSCIGLAFFVAAMISW